MFPTKKKKYLKRNKWVKRKTFGLWHIVSASPSHPTFFNWNFTWLRTSVTRFRFFRTAFVSSCHCVGPRSGTCQPRLKLKNLAWASWGCEKHWQKTTESELLSYPTLLFKRIAGPFSRLKAEAHHSWYNCHTFQATAFGMVWPCSNWRMSLPDWSHLFNFGFFYEHGHTLQNSDVHFLPDWPHKYWIVLSHRCDTTTVSWCINGIHKITNLISCASRTRLKVQYWLPNASSCPGGGMRQTDCPGSESLVGVRK